MSHLFRYTRFLLVALIACVSFSVHAQLNVYPDRFAITEGETILLTVEVDQRTSSRPDFSPLTQDFHFLGSKQMTVSSYANGENQNTTRWTILLRPRHAGDLHIPALHLNNDSSPPILISVEGIRGAAALISYDDYLESSVDSNEVYQNSQLRYSTRLFHLNDLPPMATLSEPVIADARVIRLGERQHYSRQMKGQTYQVTEQSYAIFPNKAGQLTIPSAIFSAGPGTTELNTSAVNIDVFPPITQQTRGYWLPAAQLTLEELSSGAENTLTLGESQKRTFKIRAQGLLADQLPAIMPLRNELAQIRVDDIKLEQNVTPAGIVSSRTETVIITPTERGEVTLPEITIPWWNIQQDNSSTARLPEIILNIKPAAPSPPEVTSREPVNDSVSQTAKPIDADQEQKARLLIGLLAAIAIISSLGWLYSHSSQRRKKFDIGAPEQPSAMPSKQKTQPSQTQVLQDANRDKLNKMLAAEQTAFNLAIKACYNDQPLEARLLILDWARLFWPHNRFEDSLDLSDLKKSKTLELLLIDMESYISGSESGQWSGDLLAKALEHIRS
ncbi:BatD family protein [Amphritea sp. 1_MG-2023]|uniref:BatD family protein n=1 Tax=Amphritea sp. 1_MG-2023 TaxID=3062670 RepID=UPI0026E465E2|nr:BatD family protein [Amphritea sp. 1_MG-2023]MDO6562241.1 BatD family protein [Amphritea sp. 1_MG-2023]